MKQVVSRIAYSIIALMVVITSCKKDPVIEKPGGGGNPSPIPPKNAFRIVIDALPGQSSPANNLFAIFSVSNAQNQAVVTDRKMSLTYNGKYVTDTTELFGGEYKLTKFLIVDRNNKAVFAAPIAGSQKATQVQTPLAILVNPKPEISVVPVQVLPILAGDKPQDFGYPAGSFNNPVSEQPNESPFYKIKIHPVIKIGDVVYDSIPVSFNLRTWDAAGQMLNQFMSLKAGVNEVSLPKSAARYLLIVSKWGITDELPLEKKDIQEETVYTLGGSKAEKKLKSEVSLKLINGVYKPISKDVYEYDANGRLSQIVHYLKKPDNTSYTAATDKFSYNGINKVSSIVKYGENNSILSQINFSYDQQGKVIAMVQKEGGHQTDANIDYFFLNGQSGLSGDHGITINYKYTEFYYTMRYSMNFRGGVNVEDAANTSHHDAELGRYAYDFNINPYVHLNWPDLFLSHQSKHNVTRQEKQYSGNYPTTIPYDFVYRYDNEGYPTEVVKSHMSYLTRQYLYKIKTVYTY